MQHLITQYGYLAVFVLMLAESACIPVPSEVIMMLAGALAAGAVPGAHPALLGVVIAGVAGNVAGSYIAWAVGKYAGQAAIRQWGGRIGIREHEVDRATHWFERHGPAAVLLGRIVPVVRTFISLPAGFADMPAGRFGLYTVLGCIPWTAGLGIAGYALGANWQQVANDFHGPTYAIAGILVIAIVAGIVVYRRRQKAAGANGAGFSGPGADGPGATSAYQSGSGYLAGSAYPGPASPGPAQPPAPGQYGGAGAGDWRPAQQPPAQQPPADSSWPPPTGWQGR